MGLGVRTLPLTLKLALQVLLPFSLSSGHWDQEYSCSHGTSCSLPPLVHMFGLGLGLHVDRHSSPREGMDVSLSQATELRLRELLWFSQVPIKSRKQSSHQSPIQQAQQPGRGGGHRERKPFAFGCSKLMPCFLERTSQACYLQADLTSGVHLYRLKVFGSLKAWFAHLLVQPL